MQYRILNDDELMHYGVKGMKWGKRKSKWGIGTIGREKTADGTNTFIRTENYEKNHFAKKGKQNGYRGNKIGISHDKKKRTVSVYNTFGKGYEKKYWNNENKYNKRTKKGKYGSKQWAEDGVNYTVNYGKIADTAKRKKSKAKAKINRFLKRKRG